MSFPEGWGRRASITTEHKPLPSGVPAQPFVMTAAMMERAGLVAPELCEVCGGDIHFTCEAFGGIVNFVPVEDSVVWVHMGDDYGEIVWKDELGDRDDYLTVEYLK